MKTSKKILAVVLSVMLLISVMPFAAFAATANLSDILAGATSKYVEITDTDIVVDADTTLTGHILDLYGTTTLDLNGHNLVAGANTSEGKELAIWVNPGANVTITDSAQPSSPASYNESTGALTIKAGVASISSTDYGIITEGNLTIGKAVIKGDTAVAINDNATLTTSDLNSILYGETYAVSHAAKNTTINLNKGKIFGAEYGVIGNSTWDSANSEYKYGGGVINIATANIYSTGDEENGTYYGGAIVLGADDICNITGNAKVYGYNAPAIVVRASAQLNVTGAPTVATNGTVTSVKVANGSTTVPCAPVVVDTACGYTRADDIDVDIAGGTYKANIENVENAVALVGESGEQATDYVAVTGGTYATTEGADDSIVDDTVYVQDDFGKLFLASDIGTTYLVEYTNAGGKATWQTTLSGPLRTGTYKLLGDISVTSLNVGSSAARNQDVVLDLNGNDLTFGFRNGFGSLYNGYDSSLEITGEGTVTCGAPTSNNANLSFTNGELTIGEDVAVNGSVAYFGDATVNVYGTVVNTAADDFAISSNATTTSGATLNIYPGAVVSAPNGIAIYHPDDGELNMTGGTVSGLTGIYAKAGEINISGGTVTGTGAKADYTPSGNGANSTGSAIVFDNAGGAYGDSLSGNITGGSFVSTNNEPVESAAPSGQEPLEDVILAGSDAKFSDEIDEDLVPEGYEVVYNSDAGVYEIVESVPTADVSQLSLAEITNVDTIDGKKVSFDKGYKFVAKHDAESVQDSAYKTYSADYVIKSDTDLPAGSVTLGGQYDFNGENTPWVTLTSTDDIPANTEIRLLQTLRQEQVVYTYEDICTLVREFKCAVKTNDASVAGADITVELRIYETEYNPETGLYEETGAEPIAIDDVVYELETPKVAQIGNVRYETLEAAFAAAKDGDTITLLDDCAGNGIKVLQGKFNNQGLTVDFAGHTYTVDGTTVGSTGTETQGFQLLKDNNITFQNGKIYGDSNVTTSLMFLIQNYSNLTLDNMELELIGRYYNQYTLSNNNGNIVIDDSIINAPDYSWAGYDASELGSFAFDVCRNFNYPSVTVTVTGDSVINGDIQMDALNGDAKDGMKLNLVSGTMNGNIVLTEDAEAAIAAAPEKAEAKKAATFAVDAPEGYEWNEEGVLVPAPAPVNGQDLVLTDGIEADVYLDIDKYDVDTDEAIVKVTYNKNSDLNNDEVVRGTDTYNVSEMTKYVNPQSEYNGTYLIAQSQAPAQMREDIVIELFANADAEEPVETLTTSAAALCEQVIATSNDANYVELCKRLLDYGRSAQILFSYGLDDIADSYYYPDAVQNMSAADMTRTINASMSNISFKGVSMTVLSTTKWNIVTNTAETVSSITGGSEGASAASGTLVDGNNAIIVSGINAADFANAFTVETNNGYVTLSAAMIARAIVKSTSNSNYADLARAFYLYGNAADAMF